MNDFHPVHAVEDRRLIQHRFSAFYLGIDEKAGLYLREQPDDHPDNAGIEILLFNHDCCQAVSCRSIGFKTGRVYKLTTTVCV